MTASDHRAPAPRTSAGKRDRLVAAASEVVYRQGAAVSTLADIAAAADVPLGNVYYYFKTKEEIIAAVVQAHAEQLTAGLAALERRHRSPKTRLKALVDVLAERRDEIARYGCPYGSLSAELSKRGAGTDAVAVSLLQVPLEWAERQFRAMRRRDAHDLAVELVAGYQGAAVVASTLGRPELMSRAARRLKKWIEALAG